MSFSDLQANPAGMARELRPNQGVSADTPLKFAAEVRNCIIMARQTGVKVMAMTTCLT